MMLNVLGRPVGRRDSGYRFVARAGRYGRHRIDRGSAAIARLSCQVSHDGADGKLRGFGQVLSENCASRCTNGPVRYAASGKLAWNNLWQAPENTDETSAGSEFSADFLGTGRARNTFA
jgi:hypothetical protein